MPPDRGCFEARFLAAPPGRFFDVMTNGFGRMYPYADRVSAEDRWAIAAYIRVLQRSQNPQSGDISDAEKQNLQENQLAIPPNSFVSPTAVRPQRRVEE